jgi:ribosomal protein S18 acetylase RimI-like enzyme
VPILRQAVVSLRSVMQIRPFQPGDEAAVISLWDRCGLLRPWNDPQKDIQRKLAVRPDLFLVGLLDGEVVASAMAGYEGHRGWINYLAVDPSRQRQGLGREIMAEAERLLRKTGCPKINVQVRSTGLNPVPALISCRHFRVFDGRLPKSCAQAERLRVRTIGCSH